MTSALQEIVEKEKSNQEHTSSEAFHMHLKNSIDDIFIILETIITVNSDLLELHPKKRVKKFKAKPKKSKIKKRQSTDFLTDDKLWKSAFKKMIDGKWDLKKDPLTLELYAFTLLGFYKRACSCSKMSIEEMFPVFLIAERKMRNLTDISTLWWITTTNQIKEKISANSSLENLRNTKHTGDWADMIHTIKTLQEKGDFKDAKNVGQVAKTTSHEMIMLKAQKKTTWIPDEKTIRRCLEECFDLTVDNFRQPLTLTTNVNLDHQRQP